MISEKSIISAKDLVNSKEPEPEDFVITGLPVKELGLLISGDGCDKSMLALQIAISVACGISVIDKMMPSPEKTGKVVYVSGEDDIENIHRHLIASQLPTAYRSGSLQKLS